MQQDVTPDSEVRLLQTARAGDPSASTILFETYLQQSTSIANLLRRTVRNSADREEILHEIYLQLVTSTNPFRGEARLSTYIYRVARMTVFQKFRRENTLKRGRIYRMISDPVDIPAQATSEPDYTYGIKEAWEVLLDQIRIMPALYREPVRMRIFGELSYAQIANRLNIPVNTVSTRIHKGKKILATRLREKGIQL